jgi:muramidase (phage lysozyme)
LSKIELILPLEDVVAGDYQLTARSWLEKRKLPAPMRLPAWFSPNWQHDSGWQSWPVHIAVSPT